MNTGRFGDLQLCFDFRIGNQPFHFNLRIDENPAKKTGIVFFSGIHNLQVIGIHQEIGCDIPDIRYINIPVDPQVMIQRIENAQMVEKDIVIPYQD
jgi:hypothetical protein